MDKPLGCKVYMKGNKLQVIRYILCISLCIVILGMTKVVLNSQEQEMQRTKKQYDAFTLIISEDQTALSGQLIDRISAVEGVEAVYPVEEQKREFLVLFSSVDEVTYRIEADGAKRVIARLDHQADLSCLPKQDSGRRIVSCRLMDRERPQDAAGTFQMDIPVAFETATVTQPARSYLILPEQGKIDEVDQKLRDMLKEEPIKIEDKLYAAADNKTAYDNIDENFSMLIMIVTLVASLTAGLLTYIHYTERRKEIGLLNAIGYSQKKLLIRITKELAADTLLAIALGTGILAAAIVCCNVWINEPNGYQCFSMDQSVGWIIMNVPVFMMFFSVIPIWIMLRTNSQITIVERGY